jgi:hypothetical protein
MLFRYPPFSDLSIKLRVNPGLLNPIVPAAGQKHPNGPKLRANSGQLSVVHGSESASGDLEMLRASDLGKRKNADKKLKAKPQPLSH